MHTYYPPKREKKSQPTTTDSHRGRGKEQGVGGEDATIELLDALRAVRLSFSQCAAGGES